MGLMKCIPKPCAKRSGTMPVADAKETKRVML